jgi:uncharacterized membrane protein
VNAFSIAIRPLTGLSWPLFLVWTALVFCIALLGIGEAQVLDGIPGGSSSGTLQSVPASGVEKALIGIVSAADAIWISLAAINVYIFLAQSEGLSTARRWALIVLGASAALTWFNAATGYLFGPQTYTSLLGWKFGRVLPFGVPLLWFVVLLGSRFAMLRTFPQAKVWAISAGAALLSLLTDLNLEPVAWKVRAYWIWYPLDFAPPSHPPLQNYAAWFAAAFAISYALGENKKTAVRHDIGIRPTMILVLLNTLWLSVNAARWIRS